MNVGVKKLIFLALPAGINLVQTLERNVDAGESPIVGWAKINEKKQIKQVIVKAGDSMSMGYGGSCRKYGESADFVVYEYYAYDLNVEKCNNPNRIYDGIIKIEKSAFVEPEIHKRIKRRPSGRKILVTKRIVRDIPISKYLADGKVELVNSSFCSHIHKGYGYVGLRLVDRIFSEYQLNGEIPHTVSIHV